jgi:hypothetical protein
MKECCKSNRDKRPKQTIIKKWFNYIVYAVISSIIIGALLLQLFSEKV